MPYNPGISYRGDQSLFSGITGAGDAIAEGVQQFQRDRRESEFLDAQAETIGRVLGQQPGLVGGGNPQQEADLVKTLAGFPAMSLSKKRGALASVMFAINEQDKRQERAGVQQRADQRNAIDERQIALQQQSLDRMEGNDRQRAASERDSVGLILGLSGQSKLPAPVNPEMAGEYWRQRFPNASAEVVARILDQTGPDAQRRLAISEGNLRVAESQVRNREREINQEGTPKGRTVRVTEKPDESGVAYSYDMPWEEYQAMKAERAKAAAAPAEPVATTQAEPGAFGRLKEALFGKPIPTVTTKEQFDALPSGSKYMTKDGRRATKP